MSQLSTPKRRRASSNYAINRRITAAYEGQGYSRAEFAEKLGVSAQTVRAWDACKRAIPLRNVRRAAEELAIPLTYILDGKRAAGVPPATTEALPEQLTRDGVRRVLLDIGADPSQRAALGEHLGGPSGQWQEITPEYVTAFCGAYAQLLAMGHEYALRNAPRLVARPELGPALGELACIRSSSLEPAPAGQDGWAWTVTVGGSDTDRHRAEVSRQEYMDWLGGGPRALEQTRRELQKAVEKILQLEHALERARTRGICANPVPGTDAK